MDEQLQPHLWNAIRALRIHRTALRLELRETPGWKWRHRRRLQAELDRTNVKLEGALSLAGEPPE